MHGNTGLYSNGSVAFLFLTNSDSVDSDYMITPRTVRDDHFRSTAANMENA